jgi:WD40 repeat protein
MQFSPRGDLLAVVNWAHDGVHMISRDEGRVLHTLPARQCQTVVFSLDGELVVTNSEDDLVVWRTGDWSIESQWKGHVSTIRTLAISPDGMWIASSGDDREIRLWHISDASQSRLLGQHSNPLRQVQFTPEGDSVIALDQQGNISMWSIAAGHATCQVWSQDDGVARRFALSPDRRWLAVRLHDERVLLRDLFGPLDLNPHEGNP